MKKNIFVTFLITMLTLLSAVNAQTISTTNSSTSVGVNVAVSTLTNGHNTYVGDNSGSGSNESNNYGNAFVGSYSGDNNLGAENTAVGYYSFKNNITGSRNVAIGFKSLYNVNSSYNIGIGFQSLSTTFTGINNISIGTNTALGFTDGSNNIFIGQHSGNLISSGSGNVFIGGNSISPDNQSFSNTMVFAAGYNERFRVDSNGNMGIGTIVPNNKLEIKGATDKSGLRFTNLKNTNTSINNPTNKILSVNDQGDVILVNDREGSGTGTTTNVLSLSGANLTSTVNGVASTVVLNNSGTNTDEQTLSITGGQLTISNGNTITLPTQIEIDGDVTNELQTLSQSPASTNTGTQISLSNGGGSVWVDGAETIVQGGTNVTVTGVGTTSSPYVISASGSGTSVDTSIYENDGLINASTTVSNIRTINMNDQNILFNSSTSPNNGKIYIGSQPVFPTVTGNYKLYVEGGILTEKVKVALRSTVNWADYVFEKDYKLMALNDVESFIKENKHLPNVPSAQNLVNEGLDLAEMQAKQMEKIEELTLYTIEQQKQLDKQAKEIEELKRLMKSKK